MAIPNRKFEPSGFGPRSNAPRSRFGNVADLNLTGKRGRLKQPPPEVTHAENFYYLKQMNSRTPMVIIMNDGEEIRGCIEWYDRNCLKLNRDDAPNLVIQKHGIKYVFKASERNGEE